MSSTPAASPVNDHKKTSSMEDHLKQTPSLGTNLKSTRDNMPRKAKDTPIRVSHQNDKAEEGIQVAIRMRPMNKKETQTKPIWKVLPRFSSVTQMTPDGQPVSERITGRTFFSYDKAFSETASTRDVYDAMAKGIVESAITGINGTVFAYGQTSSGKTFTMQGSGTIEEGLNGNGGGIVHMAAADIFQNIANQPNRVFLVRASFLEIYNEDVRDLLSSDNKTLPIREDPRRGVFVQCEEEIVSDFKDLLGVLFRGEKSRSFASTAMNERSSRSHTILRVTIESREKSSEGASSELNADSESGGAVLVSTLNLVDLAGSESVRHTGATGERQKEGGMINQSLLTLSRVIVALGSSNQTHINFRDSKLTRILQPSLSGNSRISFICCATPTEMCLEETRSTLQFAARAKLVKTNARVNEVLDDRSIIKKLQRELEEARRQANGIGVQPEHLKALEKQAASAGSAAREAEEKLKRLQASILNSGSLLGETEQEERKGMTQKRRLSDGGLGLASSKTPKKAASQATETSTVPRLNKKARACLVPQVEPDAELGLYKQALHAKSSSLHREKIDLGEALRELELREAALADALSKLETISIERDELNVQFSTATELITGFEKSVAEKDNLLKASDQRIESLSKELTTQLTDRGALEQAVDALQSEKLQIEKDHQSMMRERDLIVESYENEKIALKGDLQKIISAFNEKCELIETLIDKSSELSSSVSNIEEDRRLKTLELAKLKAVLVRAGKERDNLRADLIESEETNAKLEETVNSLMFGQEEMKIHLERTRAEVCDLSTKNRSFENHIENLEKNLHDQGEKLTETLDQLFAKSKELDDNKDSNLLLATEYSSLKVGLERLQEENYLLKSSSVELQHAVEKANETIDCLQCQVNDAELLKLDLENTRADIDRLETEKVNLENKLTSRAEEKGNMTKELSRLSDENQSLRLQVEVLEKHGEDVLEESHKQASCLAEKLTKVCEILEEKKKEIEDLIEQKRDVEARLNDTLRVVAGLERNCEDLKTESDNEMDKLRSCVSVLENKTSMLIEEKEHLNKQVIHHETVKAELQNLFTECDEYKEQISLLRTVISGHVTTCQKSAKTISVLQQELAEARQQVNALQSQEQAALDAKQEVNDLTKQLEATASMVLKLETQIQSSNEEIVCANKMLELSQTEAEQSQRIIEKLEIELSKRAKELESVRITHAESFKAHTEESENRINALVMQLSSLSNIKTEMEAEFSATKTNLQMYSEKASKFSNEVHNLSDMIRHKDELIRDLNDQLASGNEAKKKVLQLTDKVADLQKELERQNELKEAAEIRSAKLDDEIKTKEDELINLHEMLESSIDRETKCKQKLNDLEDELTTKETILSQSLERHQLDRKELAQEIELCQSTIEDLTLKLAQNQSTHSDSILSEMNELKMLLANSNTIADEAREKTRQALSELSRKDEDINALTMRAAKFEAQIKDMNSLYQNSTSPTEALEETLRQKEQLEIEMEQMQQKYSKFETEMISLMSEERHKIVLEAEERMRELEGELQKSRALLQQSEKDAYIARQRSDEIQDRLRASSSSSEALLSQVRQLQSENEILKDSLQREDEARSNEKENLFAEMERKVFALESEKNALRKDLEIAEYTRQSEALNSKELSIKVSEMKILLRNATAKAETARDLEKRAASAEQDVLAKEKKIRALSEEIVRLQQIESGTEAISNVVQELQEQIRQKDERIKKLKKSTLTKEQVAAMKKLKEKSKLDQENLKTAQQKIADLEIAIQSTSSGDAESTELTRLRFHIDAMEKKLRKYASHCQHLEEERARLTHVLRGAKLSEVDPEDLSRSIVNLCDKVASLEEHYRMSESNNNETKIMDKLKAQNESLESKLKQSLSEISSIRAIEQRLKVEISVMQQEQETLRKSLSESRHSADSLLSDSTRKLRFLEKENLQLMSDLKAMRKDLQNANAKISMLEITQMNATAKASPGVPNLPLYKLPPHPPLSKAEPNTAIDKENATNTIKAQSPAVTEKQVNPFINRLQQGSQVEEENTQECAQS